MNREIRPPDNSKDKEQCSLAFELTGTALHSTFYTSGTPEDSPYESAGSQRNHAYSTNLPHKSIALLPDSYYLYHTSQTVSSPFLRKFNLDFRCFRFLVFTPASFHFQMSRFHFFTCLNFVIARAKAYCFAVPGWSEPSMYSLCRTPHSTHAAACARNTTHLNDGVPSMCCVPSFRRQTTDRFERFLPQRYHLKKRSRIS